MKKILIFSFLLAFGTTIFGQVTQTTIWPTDGNPEGFGGSPDATTGLWNVSGVDWTTQSVDQHPWNDGPVSTQNNGNQESESYALARPLLETLSAGAVHSFTTPVGTYASPADEQRIEINNNVTGAIRTYTVKFDWKNNFKENCMMNYTYYDGEPNALTGYDRADLRLYISYTETGQDMYSDVETVGSAADEAGGLLEGLWSTHDNNVDGRIQIWNEDFPNFVFAEEGRTSTQTFAQSQQGIKTYLRDQPDFEFPGLYDPNDPGVTQTGGGNETFEYYGKSFYNGFNNATDYWTKYGGFDDNGAEITGIVADDTWWTTEITFAGDIDEIVSTLRGSRLDEYSDEGKTSGVTDISHLVSFYFMYVNKDGVGGEFAIDNFEIIQTSTPYSDGIAENYNTLIHGRAIDMADDSRDSSIFYTMVPLVQVPNLGSAESGYTLEFDIENQGSNYPTSEEIDVVTRYDHSSIANPEGNILGYAEYESASSAAYAPYDPAFPVTNDSFSFLQMAGSDETAYPIYLGDAVLYYQNLEAIRPYDNQNPRFDPIYTGDYTVFFESNVNDVFNNFQGDADDDVSIEMTESVLAKDDGVMSASVGTSDLYGGNGSVFYLRNKDVLSHVEIMFENDPALADKLFVLYIYQWDPVAQDIVGDVDDYLRVKQFRRGAGGSFAPFPADTASGKNIFKEVMMPGYYVALIEQKGTDPLLIGIDSNTNGQYLSYEAKNDGFTTETGGMLMLRLNFENHKPEFVNTTIDEQYIIGNAQIVDDRISIPANEGFSYSITAKDRDNAPADLRFVIANQDDFDEWLTVTNTIADENYTVGTTKGAVAKDSIGGSVTTEIKIVGLADKDNAGVYVIKVLAQDSLGNAYSYFDESDTLFIPIEILDSESIIDLDFEAYFNNSGEVEWVEGNPGPNEWGADNGDGTFDLENWRYDNLFSEDPGGASQGWERGSYMYSKDNTLPAGHEFTNAVAIAGYDYDGDGQTADQEEILFTNQIRIPSSVEDGTLYFEFEYLTNLKNMSTFGEQPGVFTGNPIYEYNMADVYVGITTDFGESWDTLWWDYKDADIGTSTPRYFSTVLSDDYIGENIQIGFIYKSHIDGNADLHPGWFAVTTVKLSTGAPEVAVADIELTSDFWEELAYKTPMSQIRAEGYPFDVSVINNGDVPMPDDEEIFLTVDVEYQDTDENTYTQQQYGSMFRNWWIIDGEELDTLPNFDAVDLTSAGLERDDVPDSLFIFETGFYRVTYTLYDWNTSFQFNPKGVKRIVYEFQVTDNMLRLDNAFTPINLVYDQDPETPGVTAAEQSATIFSQEKVTDRDNLVHLGGSLGSDFVIIDEPTDQLSDISIFLPTDNAVPTGKTYKFTVSLMDITSDTTLVWTSDQIEIDENDDVITLSDDIVGSFPTLTPGHYYFVINQFPAQSFNVLVGQGGDRMENWLDGNNWIDVDGKYYDGVGNNSLAKGAIAVEFTFSTESEAAPYYAGAPFSNNTNYVYDMGSTWADTAAIKTSQYSGDFEDSVQLYQGVTSFYQIEGRDKNNDDLSLDILNLPDGDWVSVEKVAGTKNKFVLTFETPENVVLENNYVVVKLYETVSGVVAQPALEDGLRTIHLYIEQQPTRFNGDEEWKEEFAADPGAFNDNVLNWTFEHYYGFDIDDQYAYPTPVYDTLQYYTKYLADFHIVSDNEGDPNRTYWNNRMCVDADPRQDDEQTEEDAGQKDMDAYDATNYQNEWFISEMLFIPVPAEKEDVKLTFKWSNDFFKNNGGTVGELFTGDPVNGWNNADIRLWISIDGGYSYEAQPLWGEDRDDILDAEINDISTKKIHNDSDDAKDIYLTEINLENYEEMWIKLAFQYVGRYGGSFCVDDIQIQQTRIDEFPDFQVSADVTIPPYKIPKRHFVASDIEVNASVYNAGGDFPYENEVAYVKADLMDDDDDQSAGKYTKVSSAIETLEALTSIDELNFPAFTGSLDEDVTYYFQFDVGAEQGAIWDYELSDNTTTSKSFSITKDNYAQCEPVGSMTIGALAPKGEDFDLRVDDILTKVGIKTSTANQVFYVTIFDSSDNLIFKSIPFKTVASSEIQYFGLTYDVRNGELNPETGDIPSIDDIDFGVTLPAGSYRVEINGAAAGISLAKGCGNDPYIELEFGSVGLEWVDNTPYPYAVAGCYYNSSYNINVAPETYTRFVVNTNGLDVNLDNFELLEYSLAGYDNADDGWLSPADFKEEANTDENKLTSEASAVLEGVPNADWLGTYTYKFDVTNNTNSEKAGEIIEDITIIDALKLTGELGTSKDYEPDFENFMNLDEDGLADAGDMTWPIDEERYAGGLFRINFDDDNAGWQFADNSGDGTNDRAYVPGGTAANCWLTTPLIYLPELNDAAKSYRLQFKQSGFNDNLKVKISTDGGTPDSWTTLPGGDKISSKNTAGGYVKLRLDDYQGQKVRIAFMYSGTAGDNNSYYIEDIELGWVSLSPKITIDGDDVVYKVPYSVIPDEHVKEYVATVKVKNGTWLANNAMDLGAGAGSLKVEDHGNHKNPTVNFGPLATGATTSVDITVGNKSGSDKNGLELTVGPNGDTYTYDFEDDKLAATEDGPFATSNKYYAYPRFKTNGNGIFGKDKAASFNTGNLSKIELTEKSVSFDLIAEDWLSYILVLMDKDDINDDVITFFIDAGGEIITESFAVSEGMDMSKGVNNVTVAAIDDDIIWYAFDINDILLSANSTVKVTLKDDLNVATTMIFEDGDYDEDPAIRLFLTNKAPNITNVNKVYHYPVCSEISIVVTAEDDHDAASDIDFAISSGFDTDWLTLTENGDGTATITGTASVLNIGHNRIVIEAEDSEEDKGTYEFDIVIHDIAPEFATTPDEGGSSVVEGMAYSYQAEVVDDNEEGYVWDGSATFDVTYAPVQVPAGMTVDAATGLVSWTPSGVVADGKESQDFEVIIGATVSAGCKSEMIEQTYMLTVFKNHPPVMNNVADVWTYVGADFSLQISGTDQNEDALTYAASPLPAGLAIDAATGIISGVPTQNEDIEVTATANDGLLDSDPVTFTIHVTGESTGDAFTVSFEDASATVGERIMIPITAPAGATVGIVKNEATFLSLVIDGDGNYMLSGVATTNVLDSFAITVSASDYSNDDYAEHSGSITISPNSAPVITLDLADSYNVNDEFVVTGTLTDAEGDDIKVTPVSVPQWLTIARDGNTLTATIAVDTVNASDMPETVEFIVSDDYNSVSYKKEISIQGVGSLDIPTVEGSQISVYPNPAQEFIYVEGAKLGSEVLLINATGQILARESVTQNVVEINVSSYASGLYMIQVDGISNEVIISNK